MQKISKLNWFKAKNTENQMNGDKMVVPKIVQVDKRGQIVIPKEVRSELNITNKTNLWVYSITDEGILLKKE